MDSLNHLLLDVYDSARHCNAHEFSEHSLKKLKSVMQFDSASLLEYSVSADEKISIQTIHLHSVPVERLQERPAFAGVETLNAKGMLVSRDAVLQTAFAKRGQIAIADLNQAFRNNMFLDYCRKFESAHSLVLVSPTKDASISLAAFWRADRNQWYDEADIDVSRRVLPHLLQAKQINQQLASTSPRRMNPAQAASRATVMATFDGRLYVVDADAISLLQREWKQWAPPLLPPVLMHYLGGSWPQRFVGKTIAIESTVQGDLLCLQIEALRGADSLTPAERRVAALAAQGLQYKEIAKAVQVSPATVRNQLHAAYRKLGVTNKTALATALVV